MATLLPINKPKEKDITPKVFFIWGQSMSGKTYLARQFPSPLIINTDGNAKKVDTPSVEVYDFETFIKVLEEVEEGKHEFKTIIIDLVDDIKTMLERWVCQTEGKKDNKTYEVIGDIGYGKGYSKSKSMWQNLLVRLNHLPYNVIFISHIVEVTEDNQTFEKPSLEQRYLNMTMGRCDISIKCRKVGQKYIQMCDSKRDNYNETDLKDKKVLEILKGITGVFPVQLKMEKSVETNTETKKIKPLKKAEVKEDEE